jgi:hypothetical protein
LGTRGRKLPVAGENCIMASFIIYTLSQIFYGDEMEDRWAAHVARMGKLKINAKL